MEFNRDYFDYCYYDYMTTFTISSQDIPQNEFTDIMERAIIIAENKERERIKQMGIDRFKICGIW